MAAEGGGIADGRLRYEKRLRGGGAGAACARLRSAGRAGRSQGRASKEGEGRSLRITLPFRRSAAIHVEADREVSRHQGWCPLPDLNRDAAFAATDFKSVASTIPPSGPARGLARYGRHLKRQAQPSLFADA